MPAATYLDRILAAHRAAAAADQRDPVALREAARAVEAPARGFATALTAAQASGDAPAVIAEVKRASPAKGALAANLDPVALAAAYRQGSAACLSVLTDTEFFAARPDDLRLARQSSGLPVLRKDFTVSAADVCDTRLMGADAVLLIAAALSPTELADLLALAEDVGLDALVEVHDEDEADVAVDAGARLVGVNQRDLVTFAVDPDRAARVVKALPDGVVTVAESGITGPHDAARLAGAGFCAVLVGESLVRSPDPAAAVAALRAGRR